MAARHITIGSVGDPPSPLTFDVQSLIANRLLIQANSGGGKTNAVRLLVELLSPLIPGVIIDPEGEYHTLREKVDLVVVGEGGELAASVKNAGELAIKLLHLGVSAVIDVSALNPFDRREFVKRYCENLLAAPRALWRPFMFVIDEAQLFCPQDNESVATLPICDLMTRARKREILAVLATPRLSQVNADARAAVNNFMIGRATLDVDYKRAGEILGMPSAERRTLAMLEQGHFHCFGPSFGHRGVQLASLDKAQTKPPRHGKASVTSVPAPSEAIKAVVPELEKIASADNPDEVSTIEKARARIKELRAEITKAARARVPTAPATVVRDGGSLRRLEQLVEQLLKFVTSVETRDFKEPDAAAIKQAIEAAVLSATGRIEAMMTQRARDIQKLRQDAAALKERVEAIRGAQRPRQVEVAAATDQSIKIIAPIDAPPAPSENGAPPQRGVQGILEAIAWWRAIGVERPTREQVAAKCGSHPRTKGFANNLGVARSSGFIDYAGGELVLLPAGEARVTAPVVIGVEEVRGAVMESLVPTQRRILEVVLGAGRISREDLAAQMACHPRSKGFVNNLGALRGRGLLDYAGGEVSPAAFLTS